MKRAFSTQIFFFMWHCSPTRAMTSSFLRFLIHTKRRTTVGRTPLEEWPTRRRDLYLTTNNTHNRKTSMLPTGFEPTIPVDERPQTYALHRAATGTGFLDRLSKKYSNTRFNKNPFIRSRVVSYGQTGSAQSLAHFSNKRVVGTWLYGMLLCPPKYLLSCLFRYFFFCVCIGQTGRKY